MFKASRKQVDRPRDETPQLRSRMAEEFIEELNLYRTAARESVVLAQERQARAYNKGRKPPVEFNVGDWALVNPHSLELVESEGNGAKLVQHALGPFEVMEKINPMVYRLCLPSNYPMHTVFNLAHLKKYHPSPEELGERTKLTDPRDLVPAQEEYEVEAILGHRFTKRKDGNQLQYLVWWRNYGPEDDQWVTENALRNSPLLRKEYWKMKEEAPKSKGVAQ